MRFFVGLHHPNHAQHFDRAFISVNRLRTRRSAVPARRSWIMDSGAFSTIRKHGGYPESVAEYADQIRRFAVDGSMLAAAAQDYLCEPGALKSTGLSIADHQRLTIERYDALVACDPGVYILPALQGYAPQEYVEHLLAYGDRLEEGAWVGVGTLACRSTQPLIVAHVLLAIKRHRADLRLHGFGVKLASLCDGAVRRLLYSADSMAWSWAARREGRDANDWREAARYVERVEVQQYQESLLPIMFGLES
jgi:hypothetical protein